MINVACQRPLRDDAKDLCTEKRRNCFHASFLPILLMMTSLVVMSFVGSRLLGKKSFFDNLEREEKKESRKRSRRCSSQSCGGFLLS